MLKLKLLSGGLILAAIAASTGASAQSPRLASDSDRKVVLEVSGGYGHATNSILSNHVTIDDLDGNRVSDIHASGEEIDILNDKIDYVTDRWRIGASVSYSPVRDLTVTAGIGASTYSTSGSYRKDAIKVRSSARNPRFDMSASLSYILRLPAGFYLELAPAVCFSPKRGELLFYTVKRPIAEEPYADGSRIDRKCLFWRVPLTAGVRLGRFTPFLGIEYIDMRQSDVFHTTVISAGSEYNKRIAETYGLKTPVRGIAGCSFRIASNLGLRLDTSFSRDIDGNVALFFTI